MYIIKRTEYLFLVLYCVFLILSFSCGTKESNNVNNVLLSKTGGDRATAYIMNNKIVRWKDKILVTWLGSDRINRWGLVDPKSGALINQGEIGGTRQDNHCGATIAKSSTGEVHIVIGGHWSSFLHYKLVTDSETIHWEKVSEILVQGTYPSMVIDSQGILHLTYRGKNDTDKLWTLNYAKYSKNTGWSTPQVLVKASVEDYIYWTNGLALGPDGNNLHLFFTNVRYLPNGDIYYGASHIYSADYGLRWKQFGSKMNVQMPANVNTLNLIEKNPLMTDRSLSPEYILKNNTPGPTSYLYHNMLLSNPVVDANGSPWVVIHNYNKRDADLVTYANGKWTHIHLLDKIQKVLPHYVIHPQSSLSQLIDGSLEVILQVMPKDQYGYGNPGTELIRMRFSLKGELMMNKLICDIDPYYANWQPAQEHWQWHEPSDKPALMYTKGINQGAFFKNINLGNSEVYLQIP